MRRLVRNSLATTALFFICAVAPITLRVFAADGGKPPQTLLQADRALVQAIGKADKAAVGKLLDANFTWTDEQGKSQNRAQVLQSLPISALGDESGLDVKERTYGQVGAVTVGSAKLYVLRVWVKRSAGWRALVYHQVKLSDQPPTAAGTGVANCENPCKTLPYKPKNEAERGVIASWQALETGVTAHDADAWAPHIADEFIMLSSNNDHPLTKADRMATLNKQKLAGVGSAPAPLVSAKMFDFPGTVVMTGEHQPHHGKPVHVTRVWIKHDRQWVMAISFQTAIQAAAAKT